MAETLAVQIKQQPFDPPFVIAIGGEPVPARVHKPGADHIVADLDGRGAYRIPITDVGFFFVEKEATPCDNPKAPSPRGDRLAARVARRIATAVGEHCGDTLTECKTVLTALVPRGGG